MGPKKKGGEEDQGKKKGFVSRSTSTLRKIVSPRHGASKRLREEETLVLPGGTMTIQGDAPQPSQVQRPVTRQAPYKPNIKQPRPRGETSDEESEEEEDESSDEEEETLAQAQMRTAGTSTAGQRDKGKRPIGESSS